MSTINFISIYSIILLAHLFVFHFHCTSGANHLESCARNLDCVGNLRCFPRERYGSYSDRICKCPHTDWVWNNISTCVREKCEYRLGWDSVAFTDSLSGKCVMRLGIHSPLVEINEKVLGCPKYSTLQTSNDEGWCSCDTGYTAIDSDTACSSVADSVSSVDLQLKKSYRAVCTNTEECATNLECLQPSAAWPDVKICTCKDEYRTWNNDTKCIHKSCEYRVGWDGHVVYTDWDTMKCYIKLGIPLLSDDIRANFLNCPTHSTLVPDASNKVAQCICDTGYAPHPRMKECEAFPGIV